MQGGLAEAALWGFVGASSLIVAAEIAFRVRLPAMLVGLVMAFGVGTLISAIAFELVEPALEQSDGPLVLVAGLAAGSLVFFLGDRLVAGMGAPRRGTREERSAPRSGLGIVLGTVLDGVPESAVLGMSIVTFGAVGPALLVAVWVSNLPESLGASVDMLEAGRPRRWIRLLWWGIAAASALAAAGGYAVVSAAGGSGALVQAFAAGALLTMIADEMGPEAFGRSHLYTGLATTAGFMVAFLLSALA